MSGLLDKQVYVQIKILKIILGGLRKPMRKVCDENGRKNNCIIFLWWKEEFIRLSEEWQD